MFSIFCFLLIFGSFFELNLCRSVPLLNNGYYSHAQIGNYSDISVDSCGYLSPKRVNSETSQMQRIISSNISELGEFPWHSAIYLKEGRKRTHICGGALFHSLWVLTAKQCIHPPKDRPIKSTELMVSFGSVNKNQFFKTVDVLVIIEHSKENLVLLRLKEAVTPIESDNGLDYRVNYICLPKQMIFNIDHEDALTSSFGYITAENRPPNERLRKAMYLIDPYSDCETRHLPQIYVCGTESAHMPCLEDMGSPLVQFDKNRSVLIGIGQRSQEWGLRCQMGVFVFYRISYFIDWIRDQMRLNITIGQTTQPTVSTTIQITNPLTTFGSKHRNESQTNNISFLNTNINLNLISVLILILINFYFIRN